MTDILDSFLEYEVTAEQYDLLWLFITVEAITNGTLDLSRHRIVKTGPETFILYQELITPEHTLKFENALVLGRDYLLKKINGAAYTKHLPKIHTIA